MPLAVPNPGDQSPTRWLTHPFWAAITTASDFHSIVPGGRRALRRTRAPADWFMARAFLSTLTSYMATYEEFDAGWAIQDLLDITKEVYAVREEVTGVSLARYVARSVAIKTRAYGTGAGFRVPPEIPLQDSWSAPAKAA